MDNRGCDDDEILQEETGVPEVCIIPHENDQGYRLSNCLEFPLFLVLFGISLSGSAISNLIMYRTCVHSLNYPVAECKPFLRPDRTNITQHMEAAVQQYSTFVSTVKSVLESLLPAVLALFMVTWSDKHGRKPLIVWPLLGITVSNMMTVVYSMWGELGPWWFLATSVPYSLSGGFSIMGTAAMCYVTDVTSDSSRSMRIVLLQAILAGGMAGGSLATPHLMKAVGCVYLLLISTAMITVAYAFSVVFIEESNQTAVPGSITTILNPSLLKEMFRECFKERPNYRRAQILLITLANTMSGFAATGVFGLSYMYTREILHWGLTDFTQYSAVATGITFCGSILGAVVIQNFLKIGDLPFSIIAYITTSISFYVKGMATYSWHMYLASAIAVFGDLSSALMRSMVSKIIPHDDVGKVFGLMGALESTCPIIAPLVYNALYASTIDTLPGAIMFISSDIYLINVVTLCVAAFLRRRTPSARSYTIL